MIRRRLLSTYSGYHGANDYLTFTSISDSTYTFTSSGLKYWMEYSIDNGETWVELESGIETPIIEAGNSIKFKGKSLPDPENKKGIGIFSSSGEFGVTGNTMSLIYGDDFRRKKSLDGLDYIFSELFNNCTGLTSVSDELLPATTLAAKCYEKLFRNTGLTEIPEKLLPATELYEYCYSLLFALCKNLKAIPSGLLPSKTLAYGCYANMFRESGVTEIPSKLLHATKITNEGYYQMFLNCTSLEKLPADLNLGSDRVGDFSCTGMFNGCTKLEKIPEKLQLATSINNTSSYQSLFAKCVKLTSIPENLLPATTLAKTNSCYAYMFNGCIGITEIPENLLPATTLAPNCYYYMFSGCSGITSIPEQLLPATTMNNYCYSYMFNKCTGITSIPEKLLPAINLAEFCYQGMFYSCKNIIDIPENLLPTQKVLHRQCYQLLFANCTSLTTIPKKILHASQVGNRAYIDMFQDCIGLTTAPELPATILSEHCYSGMFQNCKSLTTAPELPATTLINGCYNYMFRGCSKLNYIKALFTTEPSTSYTTDWVYGVASTGTFIKNSAATWDVTGVNGIPEGWTVEYDIVEDNNEQTEQEN